MSNIPYHTRKARIDAQTLALDAYMEINEHPSVTAERNDDLSQETYTNYLLWALQHALDAGDVNSADSYARELDEMGVEWRSQIEETPYD